MNLWIDGAGLHSFERCQRGEGRRDDALDQLHLAVQLVFADSIYVGVYDSEYGEKTVRARRALEAVGLNDGCIAQCDAGVRRLREIYARAGDRLGTELLSLNPLARQRTVNNRIHSTAVAQTELAFHHVLQRDLTDHDRRALAEQYERSINNGLMLMLAHSEAAWVSIRRLVTKHPAWSLDDSASVAEVGRVYIHDEHAILADADYSPACRRARVIRDSVGHRIIDSLAHLNGVDDFRHLVVPPVAAYLLMQAAGDPRKLSEATRVLRQRTAPLRRHLRRSSRQNPDEAQRELASLLKDVRTYVGATKADRLRFALKAVNLKAALFQLVVALSSENVGGAVEAAGKFAFAAPAAWTAMSEFRKSGRVMVLTEVVHEVARLPRAHLAELERGVSLRAPV